MFPRASHFRLDWRQELDKLGPFLNGRGGVVRIEFSSEDAAPSKFNHILKEEFGVPGNGAWLSLRVDDGWSTTYTVDDQIDAFAKKLAEAGIVVDLSKATSSNGDAFSGNSSNGDLEITAIGVTIVRGFDQSARAIGKRVDAICNGVRRLVECGGHFMVVVNDMTKAEQGRFWKQLWQAGLAEAGGGNMLLVYFVGPKCDNQPHADAPLPDLRLRLPREIEGDETRENHVYDDIIDLFTKAGYNAEAASVAATSIISSCGHSVMALQEGLAKLIWKEKAKSAGGDA